MKCPKCGREGKGVKRLRAGGHHCLLCGYRWGEPSVFETDEYGEPLVFEEE